MARRHRRLNLYRRRLATLIPDPAAHTLGDAEAGLAEESLPTAAFVQDQARESLVRQEGAADKELSEGPAVMPLNYVLSSDDHMMQAAE